MHHSQSIPGDSCLSKSVSQETRRMACLRRFACRRLQPTHPSLYAGSDAKTAQKSTIKTKQRELRCSPRPLQLKRLGDKRLPVEPESASILAIWNCAGEKNTGKARRFGIAKLRTESKPHSEFVFSPGYGRRTSNTSSSPFLVLPGSSQKVLSMNGSKN